MICILGSGFGVYGYLPALVQGCGEEIVLPERYRERFAERTELAQFIDNVSWQKDEAAALEVAEGAVLAVRPADQERWVRECLLRPGITRLILEKPLAASPSQAAALLEEVVATGKRFLIGYTFRFTPWARQLAALVKKLQPSDLVSIRWQFLADHFRRDIASWKRFTQTGGGAIRFYGIQVIALLAELGYREVRRSRACGGSPAEITSWHAGFVGPDLPECTVTVDSIAEAERFNVCARSQDTTTLITDQRSPFASSTDNLDRRVPELTELCRSLWEDPATTIEWYAEVISLWQKVEEAA